MRCHQSFIVNMERITGAKTESFSIGENVIPISRSYNKTAHERYEEYLQLQQEISWGGYQSNRVVVTVKYVTGPGGDSNNNPPLIIIPF